MNRTAKSRPFAEVLFFFFFPLVFSAPFAHGEIIYSGTNFDIQLSTPVEVGITPLKAMTLTVLGKNNVVPNSFDGTRLGGTGITTTGDALHQIWEYNASQTPTTTLIVAGSIPENLDTHFLFGTDKIISITAPNENRNTLYTVENDYGGFGNSLNGVFSLKGTPTSSLWDLAYLVVPQGAQLNFKFSVGAIGFTPELVNASYSVVPEPSMIVLLAIGCTGLLIPVWRRKRSASRFRVRDPPRKSNLLIGGRVSAARLRMEFDRYLGLSFPGWLLPRIMAQVADVSPVI